MVRVRHLVTAIVLATSAPGAIVSAQAPMRPAPSVGLTAASSVLGAAVGGLLGAIAGGSWTSRECPPGDPDACLGAAFPGFIWGAGAGMTVGAPVGAWLGSRRNGSLTRSLLASGAIFAAEVLILNSIVDDGRTDHRSAAMGIVVAAPILQVIVSTWLHSRVAR